MLTERFCPEPGCDKVLGPWKRLCPTHEDARERYQEREAALMRYCRVPGCLKPLRRYKHLCEEHQRELARLSRNRRQAKWRGKEKANV